jgi:hypothetical protein
VARENPNLSVIYLLQDFLKDYFLHETMGSSKTKDKVEKHEMGPSALIL